MCVRMCLCVCVSVSVSVYESPYIYIHIPVSVSLKLFQKFNTPLYCMHSAIDWRNVCVLQFVSCTGLQISTQRHYSQQLSKCLSVQHFELSVTFCPSRNDVLSRLVVFISTAFLYFNTVWCGNKQYGSLVLSAIVRNTETLVTGLQLSFCVVLHCIHIVTTYTAPVYYRIRSKISI